jgi:hypothetical protein
MKDTLNMYKVHIIIIESIVFFGELAMRRTFDSKKIL